MQDDHEDWAREAARMSTIYQNAFVTISATASKSGDEGLFRRCSENEVQFVSKGGGPITLIFSEERFHVGEFYTGNYPLLKRAWALQERLLSPRILHYTHQEMAFECTERQQCECASRHDSVWDSDAKAARTYMRTEVSSTESVRIWKLIIWHYSLLDLTHVSDKLMAVAGLAKTFARPEDRYVAGFWMKGLHDQLQWGIPPLISHPKPRPAWRAPSWSWSAVDDSVHFLDYVTWSTSRRSLDDHTASAEILECIVVPKSGDHYGELQSGRLRLLGRCAQVVWNQEDRRKRISFHDSVTFPNGTRFNFYLDASSAEACVPDTRIDDSEVTCILFFVSTDYCTSLILRRSETEIDTFERIGIMMDYRGGKALEDLDNLFPRAKTIVDIV